MLFRKPSGIFKKNLHQKKWGREIDPDEVLLDSANLPKFDRSQFEGRLEKPLSKRTIITCGIIFFIGFVVLIGKIYVLQITDGQKYKERSENNTLRQTRIYPERGVIYDRNKLLLASNVHTSTTTEFSKRLYVNVDGMSHVLGYVRYPLKDKKGVYFQDQYEGVEGVEKIFNKEIAGTNGVSIVETNALGQIESRSLLEPPRDGNSLTLSIDSKIQEKAYQLIKKLSDEIGFFGGAGIITDVDTGEILTMVSFPEYNSNIMSDRTNSVAIKKFINDKHLPFLNRVTDGLYTPGSIIKPFVALAALNEKIIEPKTKILSTGSISIPNPFDKTKKTVFNDWKAHGYVDMREALAVSSDVYFYEIGGGFENQIGLGIQKIGKYMSMFGFGEIDKNNPLSNKTGVIPSPAWKAGNFKDGVWRIGDTYNTSIGQYGFLVTPMQAVRATASIANGGKLITPTLLKNTHNEIRDNDTILPFSEKDIEIIREGMRQAVTSGTAKGLDIPEVKIAAKTGTAELGISKKYVNSWITGFFPYERPRFAFAVIMERGPYDNTIGALYVMRQLIEWMAINTPEYFESTKSGI